MHWIKSFEDTKENLCLVQWTHRRRDDLNVLHVHGLHFNFPKQGKLALVCTPACMWTSFHNSTDKFANAKSTCMQCILYAYKKWYSLITERTCNVMFKIHYTNLTTHVSIQCTTHTQHAHTCIMLLFKSNHGKTEWILSGNK